MTGVGGMTIKLNTCLLIYHIMVTTIVVNEERYKVIKTLGKGAYGILYGCKDSGGKPVAIKQMVIQKNNTAALNNIKREITLMQKVSEYNHKGIIHFIDWEYMIQPEEVTYLIVMEWVRGDTIRGHMTKGTLASIPMKTKISIMMQIASAINFLHEIGIVHRDIKVENTMLVKERSHYIVKIIDFGFAALYNPYIKKPGMTETAHNKMYTQWCNTFTDKWLISDTVWKGTPSYIAPELWNKEVPVSETYILKATDVFATGCLFYRLVNDKSPWNYVIKDKKNKDILGKEIISRSYSSSTLSPGAPSNKRVIASNSGIPELDIIINYMMSRKPEDRPSMLNVHAKLVSIYKDMPSPRVRVLRKTSTLSK